MHIQNNHKKVFIIILQTFIKGTPHQHGDTTLRNNNTIDIVASIKFVGGASLQKEYGVQGFAGYVAYQECSLTKGPIERSWESCPSGIQHTLIQLGKVNNSSMETVFCLYIQENIRNVTANSNQTS